RSTGFRPPVVAGGKLTPLRRLKIDPLGGRGWSVRGLVEPGLVFVIEARRRRAGRGAVGRVAPGAFRWWGVDQGVVAAAGGGAEQDPGRVAFGGAAAV